MARRQLQKVCEVQQSPMGFQPRYSVEFQEFGWVGENAVTFQLTATSTSKEVLKFFRNTFRISLDVKAVEEVPPAP